MFLMCCSCFCFFQMLAVQSQAARSMEQRLQAQLGDPDTEFWKQCLTDNLAHNLRSVGRRYSTELNIKFLTIVQEFIRRTEQDAAAAAASASTSTAQAPVHPTYTTTTTTSSVPSSSAQVAPVPYAYPPPGYGAPWQYLPYIPATQAATPPTLSGPPTTVPSRFHTPVLRPPSSTPDYLNFSFSQQGSPAMFNTSPSPINTPQVEPPDDEWSCFCKCSYQILILFVVLKYIVSTNVLYFYINVLYFYINKIFVYFIYFYFTILLACSSLI